MTNKDLTIIITTFHSERRIENCLNSISHDYRVIIIENSRNIDFKNNIEKKFPNVECFIPLTNLGYSQGNNLGLEKVKTKYSLVLNPDTKLEKNALENFFERIKKIKDFAILAPRYGQSYDDVASTDVSQLTEKIKKKELVEFNKVKGFAMFLNMKKFSRIGFFDHKFFMFFEEIDLCRRVKNHNEKIFLDPTIEIEHVGGESVDEDLVKSLEFTRNWHWMWSTFYYHKKYDGFLIAFIKVSPKFFSAFFKKLFYQLVRNSVKKNFYANRLSGLKSSILGEPSWHRPTLD